MLEDCEENFKHSTLPWQCQIYKGGLQGNLKTIGLDWDNMPKIIIYYIFIDIYRLQCYFANGCRRVGGELEWLIFKKRLDFLFI